MTIPSDFFIAGGTLRAQAPSYVTRPADEELFEHTLSGEFCYVLTPRQMGKSSLMIRTARRLADAGRAVAILDLTGIGSGSADQWYQGLLEQTARDLRLSVDVPGWWQERASLAIPQRFAEFLRDVALQQVTGAVVIFIDEIDSTLSLDFRDDFFAAIRAIYNARATESTYKRLTFALLGVATPTDLIHDRERTPFNIGRRIVLQEFSYDQAESLRAGLEARHPGQGDTILRRIFDWTNGYPYLTQKLCLAAAERPDAAWDGAQVDELVETTFFSDDGRKDPNFKFVQQRIQDSATAERWQMLKLYRKVYSGAAVPDDDRSQSQNYLELYGLVRVEKGQLSVRNDIYRRIFDQKWIEAHTPANRELRLAIGASVAALLVIVVVAIALTRRTSPSAALYIKQFNDNAFPTARIEALAGLLELQPGEDDSDDQEGLALFYNLGPYDQLGLFSRENARATGQEMVAVIRRISLTLDDQDSNDQAIMGEMITALQAAGLSETDSPVQELENWKSGRKVAEKGQYQKAIEYYDRTIELDNDNLVAHYDRAVALIGLKQYESALTEFDQILHIAATILPTPTPTSPPTASPTRSPTVASTPSTLTNPSPQVRTPIGATPLSRSPIIPGDTSSPATSSSAATATPILTATTTSKLSKRLRFVNREEIVNTIIETIRADPNLVDFLNANPAVYQQLNVLAGRIGLPASSAPTGSSPNGAPPPEPPGKLVYTDDFGAALEAEKEKSGLEDQRDAPDFQRGFHSPGVYHFKLLHPNETYWEVLPRFAYRDFTMQLELWDNSDTFEGDVAQGILFRVRDDDHFYALLIDPRTGQYRARKHDGKDTWVDLITWKQSPLVRRQNEHNLVRIDATGDSFTIYLNNALLDRFQDSSFGFGMVGMIVDNRDAVTPHMHFDNLNVWSADSATTGELLPARDGMVAIVGGEFVMGSYQRDDQQPPHIVALPNFYIDQAEVTNAAYEQCVAAGMCTPPVDLGSYSHLAYYADPAFAAYPVINVTWAQARAYCGWAGKRLPTEAEWEKAASWNATIERKTIWPWDGPFDNSLLNTDARLGDTAAVRQFPAELNGTFDMAGNVSEWTSSRYLPYPYDEADGREDPQAIGERVFRGGTWAQSTGALTAFRNHAAQSYRDFEIGFRCAATDPLPLATNTASIDAASQSVVNRAITVARVIVAQDGWVVVYLDEKDAPGGMIGQTFVRTGENSNVTVKLSEDVPAGGKLWAMLHIDGGQPGVYEFPGPDTPVIVDGNIIMKQISIIVSSPQPTPRPRPTPRPPTPVPPPPPTDTTTPMPLPPTDTATPTPLPSDTPTEQPRPTSKPEPKPTPRP